MPLVDCKHTVRMIGVLRTITRMSGSALLRTVEMDKTFANADPWIESLGISKYPVGAVWQGTTSGTTLRRLRFICG